MPRSIVNTANNVIDVVYDHATAKKLLVVILVIVFYAVFYGRTVQRCNDVFSSIIHRCLLLAYRIDAVDGSGTIPTCQYRWPNGQGDVGKFLEGEKNGPLWSKEHGIVYRIWNGMNGEVVLADPRDIKTVFRDSDKHYKGTNNNAGWLMGEILGDCLGLVSRSEWHAVHASVSGAFTFANATARLPRISQLVGEYFADMHTHGRLRDGILNPSRDLRMLPFWVVADYIYGPLSEELKYQLQSLTGLREDLFSRVIRGGLTRFSWSRHLPTKTNRELREFQRRWKSFNDQAYERSRKDGQEAPPLVQMYDAMHRGSMTERNLLQTVDEMLFANLDVTIGAMSWNPMFLAAHQDVQEHLRREIRGAGLGTTASEKYLLSSQTLLSASILESARLKPLAAFSIPQAAPTDRLVGGFLVPAGTNFIIDTHGLNMRDSFWGADGKQYRPSRFLEGNISSMRYNYWRFGFGARQCLGKYVSDLVLRCTVAHLLGHYKLELATLSTWDKNPELWISQADTDLRCTPI